MTQYTAGSEQRDYLLDWLTGLLPITLIALFNYRWRTVLLILLAVGGYLMATVLTEWLQKRLRDPLLLPKAFLTGLLLTLCLPSSAPFWPAALAGGIAAAADALPMQIGKISLPRFHPVALTYVLLRLLFPGAVSAGFVMPYQWTGMDTLSTATPLAALRGGETLHSTWQLFFGVRAGAIGELCVAAVLLSAAYLLLRRRLRLIAPACMLATVALLSWAIWNSPLYGLLAGATALTALLLADRAYAPETYGKQMLAGIVAGMVTVLVRRFGSWADGTSLGLLAAYLLIFLCPYLRRLVLSVPAFEKLRTVCHDIFDKKKNNG